MSSTPFTIASTLNIPDDTTLPPSPIPFNVSSQFTSLSKEVLQLVGSGSQAVSFSSVGSPGAKGILIKVDPSGTAQPVLVQVNGGSSRLEIAPGGGFLYANPAPSAGITALTVFYATTCTVRIWVLG